VVDLDLIAEFLNTLDARTFGQHTDVSAADRDEISTPALLAGWLADRKLIRRGARVSADDHRLALRLRRELRVVVDGGRPAALNTLAREFPMVIRFGPEGAAPELTRRVGAVSAFFAEILFTCLSTSVTGEWRLLKMCAAEDCGWIFHDESRNHLGRWCNMNVCGNRMKTRAYRARRSRRVATRR
jgi:predicted RNA-binding Zn ribbon-like protein